MNEQKLILERIKKIVGVSTNVALANKFNKSKDTIDNWIRKGRKVPLNFIKEIANVYNASYDWILTGQETQNFNDAFQSYDMDSQSLNKEILHIPFYEDIRASAGTGCINGDCKPTFIKLASKLLPVNSANIEAIRVMGDSMVGTIDDGDVIFVDKNHLEPLNGKIYVVFMCDEVYVKRIFRDPNTQKLILKSDNPVYPQFEADCEDFKIIGKVIANMNIKEL